MIAEYNKLKLKSEIILGVEIYHYTGVTWRKICRKTVKWPYQTHCNLVHQLLCDENIDTQLHI